MIQQIEITLKSKSRGFHLVTSEILSQLPKLPKTGIMNIFCKHTSCGLSINENADPDVRVDMETIFNRLVPENRPEYEHTLEGADDMPAHAKSTLSGVSLTIPITDGHLNMGTWQGIYFCEYRNYGGARRLANQLTLTINEPEVQAMLNLKPGMAQINIYSLILDRTSEIRPFAKISVR